MLNSALSAAAYGPLISWVQAGEWAEIAGNFELGSAEDLLPYPVRYGVGTCVLLVLGESFKQLILEEGHQYLKTMNPDWLNGLGPTFLGSPPKRVERSTNACD